MLLPKKKKTVSQHTVRKDIMISFRFSWIPCLLLAARAPAQEELGPELVARAGYHGQWLEWLG